MEALATIQTSLFREGFRKKIPSLASKNPFAKQILHGFLLRIWKVLNRYDNF